MKRAIRSCALGSFVLQIGCGGTASSIGRTGPGGGGGTSGDDSGSGSAAGSGGTSGGDSGSGGVAGAGAPSSGGSGTGGTTTVNIFVDVIPTDSNGCLPRALAPPEFGSDCHMIEATTDAAAAACALPARSPVSSEEVAAAIRSRMETSGLCGPAQGPTPDCTEFHPCEIAKADSSCLQAVPSPDAVGWCYIDPDNGVGDPSLVESCPASSRRIVRFVGADTPVRGAVVLVMCGTGF